MKRRQFLTKGTIGMASVGLLSQVPQSLFATTPIKSVTVPIGFQSYVLRKDIGLNLDGTLKKMVDYGYEYVEMCSPSGYMNDFAPLAKYSGKELKSRIEDTGIKCMGSHFTWNEMQNNLDERLEFANQLGLRQFVCSGGLDAPTEDEVKRKCAALNAMGEKIKSAGMVAGYHNHEIEFKHEFNGRPEYDLLLEELDPDKVKMQFQTQVITLGYKASTYFKNSPGRFISAHLQDYSPTDHTKEVVLGQGIADWKDFFSAAKVGGLQIVYVEMESNPGTLRDSVSYLKKL